MLHQPLFSIAIRFILFLAAISFLLPPDTSARGNSKATPDKKSGDLAWDSTSLELDSAGNPVISYGDVTNGRVKILHCKKPTCKGGGNSITSPVAGIGPSLKLDLTGNPVVAYAEAGGLKILHCNDPNCEGGDESITSPDSAVGRVLNTSLELDSSGFPVVSYSNLDTAELKILHCNDPDCFGGDESITIPDSGNGNQSDDVGRMSSLELDSNGYPVVSYLLGFIVSSPPIISDDLRILHCNDPNCDSAVNGPESITSPDTVGSVGHWTSLKLDSLGNPVVSYYDSTQNNDPNLNKKDLKVMHCNDPNCDSAVNGPESITSPDTEGEVGLATSLELDSVGNPVVSYWDLTNGDLKVLHCDDPDCASDESANITSPDTREISGLFTSLKLDDSGNPVISHIRRPQTGGNSGVLRVVHCGSPTC